MKPIIRLFLAIIFCQGLALDAIAQQPELRADSAYMAEQYDDALTLYQQVMQDRGVSSDLWYNIGNCYYRLGQNGKAILAYERALRIDPANSDARENLAFVNQRITDRPGERGTFISNFMDNVASNAASNTWAWLALGFFALTIIGAVIYLFLTNVTLRKVGFFGGIVTLIVCVFCVIMAIHAASIATATDRAVITAPSTILSTSPRAPKDRTEEAMMLHEGTKLEIMDSVTTPTTDTIAGSGTWLNVKIDNAHRAWVRRSDVEII